MSTGRVEERKTLKLTACGVWLGAMHWTFNLFIGICILFDIYKPWFGFPELFSLPISHMWKNILWVGISARWGTTHYMGYNSEIVDKARCCYNQTFLTCVQDPHKSRACSSSLVRPDDIPRAAAQPVCSRSTYVAQREIWSSYLKFLPEKNLRESYSETFWDHFVDYLP